MGDAGVGEQALNVALEQGTEVADGHRQRCQNPHKDRPAVLHLREAGEGDAEQDGEGSGLGRGGHEADDRGGCTLIDVGRPDMERSGGDLEAQADKDEGEGGEGEGRGRSGLEAEGDGVDVGRAGGPERESDAVKEEGGGEGAEQEVLDGGLGAGGLALAEAAEDVGGNRGDFEADEDHEELDRAGHEHHADGAEAEQGEVLACVAGVAFEVVE